MTNDNANINFFFLEKDKFDFYAGVLFSILAFNMTKILPTGNTYDEDYQIWYKSVNEAIKKAQRQIVISIRETEIIGYVQYYTNNALLMIEEVQIIPGWHGKGKVFRRLFGFIISALPEGIDSVEAYANKKNIKSQGILSHLGLKIIGENKTGSCFHYRGNFSDILNWYKIDSKDNISGCKIIIRNANDGDVEQIKFLIDRNFDEVIAKYHSTEIVCKFKSHNSINDLRKQLNWKKVYVADDNGVIVGTGAFVNFGSKEFPKYSISNLFVLPEFQGKRIGTRIVETLLEDAKKNKAYSFHVPSTRNGISFYRKLGFVVDELQSDVSDEVTWMSMIVDYKVKN